MDHPLDYLNIKQLLLLQIKKTADKFITLLFNNLHLLLICLLLKLMQLVLTEQRIGGLNLNSLPQLCNHFFLLTLFLVLEEHEMIY